MAVGGGRAVRRKTAAGAREGIVEVALREIVQGVQHQLAGIRRPPSGQGIRDLGVGHSTDLLQVVRSDGLFGAIDRESQELPKGPPAEARGDHFVHQEIEVLLPSGDLSVREPAVSVTALVGRAGKSRLEDTVARANERVAIPADPVSLDDGVGGPRRR